jgi:hypothetical protein
MTPKALFNEGKNNQAFLSELQIHEPENYKPKFWWDNDRKIVFVSIYMGWLIAKGLYNESNYETKIS